MFTVIYSILAPNGVCVAAGGGKEGGSGTPMQFIPAACTVCPQWTSIPACSCSVYTSFLNKNSAPLCCYLFFSVHCLFDLRTVHLTKTASVAKVKMEQSSTYPANSY